MELDRAAQTYFDALREQYYPRERNLLGAHVSLFHKLPGTEEQAVLEAAKTAGANRAPLGLTVAGLQHLGHGVAFAIESEELSELHRELAKTFAAWLTPQDKQRFRPHITVQNKATRDESKQLFELLRAQFQPHKITGTGVELWRYLGGPWEPIDRVPFGLI